MGASPPPLYYGTIDATALWVSTLHDAWRAGVPDAEVEALLPTLEGALRWVVEDGDADGDGFLEYLDHSGHGLANQGWKDSADSVRFADGTIAEGPVALSEVQAYAYEAAVHGADLLDAFGRPGASGTGRVRGLADRFRRDILVRGRPDVSRHWPDGRRRSGTRYEATSATCSAPGCSIRTRSSPSPGCCRHLRTGTPASGCGRMAASDGGYSPSAITAPVWPHDTAIAIQGLVPSGTRRARGADRGSVRAS